MKIDYDVGDVVVCVMGAQTIKQGEVCRVSGFRTGGGHSQIGYCELGVFLEGRQSLGSKGSYDYRRFRKLPKADDEFTEYMRRMKPANKRVDA